MNDPDRPTRDQLTLETLIDITFSNLAAFLIHESPEKTLADFGNEYIRQISLSPINTGDKFLAELKEELAKTPGVYAQFGTMVISCAYCIDARNAMKQGNRERAWSFMADARYWCGVTMASIGLDEARKKTVKASRKETASKGGEALAKKGEVVKAEAFRLAREKRPDGKLWQSRSKAASAIAPLVVEFSRANGGRLSTSGAERTIYLWLAKMTDYDELFRQERQLNQKRRKTPLAADSL